MAEAPAIRDRIRELRRVPASELRANPKNWRRHPKAQQAALRGVLAEIGYADALIARETPEGLILIDGHLRAETTPEAMVPVLILDVTEEEADKILLTLDPLAAMAETDRDSLAALLASVTITSEAVASMVAALAPADDAVAYTQKLESPVYTPSGARYGVEALYDVEKAARLLAEIERADLDPGLRTFLIAAAQRHVVFHFDRIADYYAGAPAEVQALMERSALVIVDSEQAIENGFLTLHEDVLQSFIDDYPNAI